MQLLDAEENWRLATSCSSQLKTVNSNLQTQNVIAKPACNVSRDLGVVTLQSLFLLHPGYLLIWFYVNWYFWGRVPFSMLEQIYCLHLTHYFIARKCWEMESTIKQWNSVWSTSLIGRYSIINLTKTQLFLIKSIPVVQQWRSLHYWNHAVTYQHALLISKWEVTYTVASSTFTSLCAHCILHNIPHPYLAVGP